MKKEKSLILIVLVLSIILTPAISAELLISQTDALYNIGDQFNISIIMHASKDISAFFTAQLVCPSKEIEIYKTPVTLRESQEKEVSISAKLDELILGEIPEEFSEECFISSSYNNIKSKSQKFEITNNIDVSLTVEGAVFNPGENINVYGKAIKSNKQSLNGFVKITIPEIDFSYTSPVKQGDFNFNFSIPENAYSGNYEIKAIAYEGEDENKINSGEAIETIKIKQVMRKIEIALNKQSITPNTELLFTVFVKDQANEQVTGDIAVIIYRPDSSILKKTLVKTEQPNSLLIESNYTPGYWKIEAKISDLKTTKSFFVEELKTASFTLINQTLVVLNTGNVPYDKPVEISIGGVKEIKEVNLKTGELKKFQIKAPNGNYDIAIDDGASQSALGNTYLTGNTISVDDIGRYINKKATVLLIWTVVLLAIAGLGFYFYRRYLKKKKNGKILLVQKNTQTEASPTLSSIVDKGQKQEVAVISLDIKNMVSDTLNSEALKTLESSLWKAKESGAKVYTDKNYRIIIFSQTITKERDNSLRAVRTAQDIERILKSHNKRYISKINFGIGVNIGELIIESKDGKFRFISTGNVLSTAKKISQQSNSDVLISEILRRKLIGKIKIDKLPNNTWRIKKITDRSEHMDFIKKFSERQKN